MPEFLEEEVSLRGVTYKLRELSIGDYDELVRKATRTEMNPLTGQNEESTDNSLLLKLMVMKCSVEPKITPEVLSGLPMRAALKLNQTVNRMHYGDEPVAKPEASADAPTDEAASGNA